MKYFLPHSPDYITSAVFDRKQVDGGRGNILAIWSADSEGRLRTRLRHELMKARQDVTEILAPAGGVVTILPERFASESLWDGITTKPLIKDAQTVLNTDKTALNRARRIFSKQSGFIERDPLVVGRNRFGFMVTDRTFGRTAERAGRNFQVFTEWGFTDGVRNLDRSPDMFYRALDQGSLLNNARSIITRMDQGEGFSESKIKSLAEIISTPLYTVTSHNLVEALEAQVARSIVKGELNTRQSIEEVMLAFPRGRERSSNTIALQQYSTPFPFGDAASNIFGTLEGRTVLDPTIGNGALVASMSANGAEVTGIELDHSRMLRASFALGETSTILHGSFDDYKDTLSKFDTVFVNPPFGQLKNKIEIPDRGHVFPTKALHYQITVEALQKLKAGGDAFIVLPADIYNPTEAGKASERFGNWLRLGFEDVQEAICDSRLYRGMGADVPVQIYAARGFREQLKNFEDLAAIRADSRPKMINSFDDLYDWSRLVGERFLGVPYMPDSEFGPEMDADSASKQDSERSSSQRRKAGHDQQSAARAAPRPDRDDPTPSSHSPAVEQDPEMFEGVGDSGLRSNARRIGDDQIPLWLTEGTISDDTQRYQPFSTIGTSNTVIPKSLSGATYDALRQLEESLGNRSDGSKRTVDDYVAELLGVTVKDLEASQILSPEQVDAVALLNSAASNGKGALVGDLMGVGKGRTLAALAETRLRTGAPVLFVTISPSPFSDFIMRDLQDVSQKSSEERISRGEIRPYLINSGAVLQDYRSGKTVYKQPINKKNEANEYEIDLSANLVATSYSQFQTRDGRARLRAIKEWIDFHIANGDQPLILLDESHNAASPTSNTGAVFQELTQYAEDVGSAVIRSSATGIKSGKHIELYYSCLPDTGLGKLELIDVMANNLDLSLQEALAHEMAANGTMIVRQLSSAGVGREFPRLVDFDREKIVSIRNKVDESTAILREIVEQIPLITEVAAGIAKDTFGGSVSARSGKDKLRLDTNSPMSNLHHFSGYLTLGVKGQFLDHLITDSIARGEKPCIVVEHVGTSVLDWKLSQPGAVQTDANGEYLATPPHLGDVLKRYVDRALEVKASNALGSGIDIDLKDVFEDWRNMMFDQIDAADLSSFRIDGADLAKAACDKLELSCGEITGRTKTSGKRGVTGEVNGRYYLYDIEGNADSSVNLETARQFNNGDLDVIVINRSASTAISLQASPANGDDCRRRAMIKLEIQADIVQERQIDGRVDRNGQIEPPRYSTPLTGLASDDRLASLFNRKNRSLSASTNATRENDKTIDEVVDLLNEVGQEVVVDYLRGNAFLAQTLEIDLNDSPSPAATTRKLMGRLICLPLDTQQSVLGEIDISYRMRLEYLDARGLNPLKNNKYDWRGKIVSDEVILHENRVEGIASQPVKLAVVEAPTVVEPLSFEKVMKEAGRGLALKMNLSSGTQPIERLRQAFKDDPKHAYATPNLDSIPFQKAIKRLDRSLFEGGAGLDLGRRTGELQSFLNKSSHTRYGKPSDDPKELAFHSLLENAEALRRLSKVINIGGAVGIDVDLVPELRNTRLAKTLNFVDAPTIVPAIITDCYSSSAYPLDPDYWTVTVAVLGESETQLLPVGNILRSVREDPSNAVSWGNRVPFYSFDKWVDHVSSDADVTNTLTGWLIDDGRGEGLFADYRKAQDEMLKQGSDISENAPLSQREDQKDLLRNLYGRTVAGTVMENKHVMMGNMFRAIVLAQEGDQKSAVHSQKIMFSTDDGAWHHAIEIEGGAKNAQVEKIRDKAKVAAISSPNIASPESIAALTKLVLGKHSYSSRVGFGSTDRELVDALYDEVGDRSFSSHITDHRFQPFSEGLKPVSSVFIGPDIFSSALLQPARKEQKTYSGLNRNAAIQTDIVVSASEIGDLFHGYHSSTDAVKNAVGSVQRDFKKGEMYYFTSGTSSCLVMNPKNTFLQDHFPDLLDRASNKQLRVNSSEYTLKGGMVTIGIDWTYPTDATHDLHERICEAISELGRASDQLPLLSGAFRDLTENFDRFYFELKREVVLSRDLSSDLTTDISGNRLQSKVQIGDFSL